MSGQRMMVVSALPDEPLRAGRKGPLYLVRGYFQAAGAANLTPVIAYADRFLSEIGAQNVAKRMGLTKFELAPAVICDRCNDTGWIDGKDYPDGSSSTARRCPRGCRDQ